MQLPYLDWVNQDSPYLRQHRAGFRLLRFDGELEATFNAFYVGVSLLRMRWALLVAMLLMLLFGVLDTVSLPPAVHDQALAIRLGLVAPMLLLCGLATYRRALQPYLQLIGGATALAAGLGVAGIIWIAREQGFPPPYEGIVLVTLFFYLLAGLRFVTAALCGWLTFIVYLLVAVDSGLTGQTLLYDLFFLGSANLVGCFGCYFLEYTARQNFLVHGLLHSLAEKDFITGLLNRRVFSERAERNWRQAVRERQTLALVMMDVDYFKRFNDLHGHAAGDEALRAVAEVIVRHARRPLDISARYDGGEFACIWYGLEEGHILQILETIRAEVEALSLAPVKSQTGAAVTLSIGLAHLLPQPRQNLEDSLRLADVALHLAREQGRNRVVGKRPGSSFA